MRLAVLSHKPCWRWAESPSGFATDGGFPMQMRALSELFGETVLVVPCIHPATHAGQVALTGHNLTVSPLACPHRAGWRRKLALMPWLAGNGAVLTREVQRADAIHAPIPGDIGTLGMMLALLHRKPLLVRYCGNWLVRRTAAERFWKWSMERFAGGRNVMLATGGGEHPPSLRNAHIRWIFSTSLTAAELRACSSRCRAPAAGHARLIAVGRQEGGKGTAEIIDSIPLISRTIPEVTLDVVGDGSALPGLKGLAEARGLSDRVVFHGRVDHDTVLRLLHQADVFCFPTASEGFPKAVLEALACGLPVITTRVSVLPQLIANGCGILLDKTTPFAISEAVCTCLADRERYHRMSIVAAETASAYSLECWRDSIGRLLQQSWGPLGGDLCHGH